VAVVAACLVPGPVAGLLAVAPLRRLGQISYGLYLFHWPVFRWLSPERLGTSRTVAFLVAVPVSVALAALSSTLLETPIRTGAWPRPRDPAPGRRPPVLALAAGAAAALVVAGALLVPTEPVPIDIDATAAEFDRLASRVDVRPGAPVIGVFGDSTATAMSLGLAQWAQATGNLEFGPGMTELGCGIIIEGEIRYGTRAGDPSGRCEAKDERYTEAAAQLDLAIVQYGPWDVADHVLPGVDGWRTVGDPTYDAALIDEALRLIDLLTADGAVVLWVQPPLVRLGTVDGRPPAEPFPTSDPDRMHRFREIGEELAEARPDTVRLVDLAGWMADLPGGELTPDLRPDGVHFTQEAALFAADEFIGPAIEDAWDEVRDQRGS
jgi:lysophospholipase L1-like esterase